MQLAAVYTQKVRAQSFVRLSPAIIRHFIATASLSNDVRQPKRLSNGTGLQEKFDEHQHAKLAEMLEQGCQVWEAAELLQKPRNIVKDYIASNSGLYGSVKPFKEGAWSKLELERLEYLIWNKDHPRSIAQYLGRRRAAIRWKARNMLIASRRGVWVKDRWTRNLADWPDWQWDEDAIMQARVEKVWTELMKEPMTNTWRKIISSKPGSVWVHEICSMLTVEVKRLLARDSAPTVRKLLEMPWHDTEDPGVYARLWRRKGKGKEHITRLYVGSALVPKNGLRGIKQHLFDQKREGIAEWAEDLSRGFITLMIAPVKPNDQENAERVRQVITLGQALLSCYLGAIERSNNPSLSPWLSFPYKGSEVQDPLTKATAHLEPKIPTEAQHQGEESDFSDETGAFSAFVKARSDMEDKLADKARNQHESTRMPRRKQKPKSQPSTWNHFQAKKRLKTSSKLNK